MHRWVSELEVLYKVVLLDDIATMFIEKSQYDANVLLVLDASLINKTYHLADFCQFAKKVIVVGDGFIPRQQIQFIFDGASGYSNKEIDQQLIVRAVDAVLDNEIWLERHLIPYVLKGAVAQQYFSKSKGKLNIGRFEALSILTQREFEVIEHIYRGADNLAISNALHISVRTVKAHLTAIFRKLQVQDRFQLVVFLKDLHVAQLPGDRMFRRGNEVD